MSDASDLAPLAVDVGWAHMIATRAVLMLAVPETLCQNALDLFLLHPLRCILEAWNTFAFEVYVQSSLSISMNADW